MPSLKQIQKDIESVDTIRSISSALLEVSAARIQNLRADFDHNKQFYAEISELYEIVELSAIKLNLDKSKANKTKGTINVAITSNKGFYGQLNVKVIDGFSTFIEKDTKGKCLVVGEKGRRYMEQSDHYERCDFMSFKNDYPTVGETNVFLNKVSKYKHINVFYPKFISVFSQDVHMVDITHTEERVGGATKQKVLDYIYEPELIHILHFFETQVRYILFMRIMLEAELARLAARLVKMTTTEERANDMIKVKRRELKKEIAIQDDIKLLESLSGINQWKR